MDSQVEATCCFKISAGPKLLDIGSILVLICGDVTDQNACRGNVSYELTHLEPLSMDSQVAARLCFEISAGPQLLDIGSILALICGDATDQTLAVDMFLMN